MEYFIKSTLFIYFWNNLILFTHKYDSAFINIINHVQILLRDNRLIKLHSIQLDTIQGSWTYWTELHSVPI